MEEDIHSVPATACLFSACYYKKIFTLKQYKYVGETQVNRGSSSLPLNLGVLEVSQHAWQRLDLEGTRFPKNISRSSVSKYRSNTSEHQTLDDHQRYARNKFYGMQRPERACRIEVHQPIT